MHDLGRWRLCAIEQERASLSDDLRAVFEALETGELAYGAQATLSARRIRALQKRIDALARESARRARSKARRTRRRAKLAEQAAGDRRAALSRREGAQGAGRPHRRALRTRKPRRKPDVRLSGRPWPLARKALSGSAMAFNPRSDVVLEVINAADPARAQPRGRAARRARPARTRRRETSPPTSTRAEASAPAARACRRKASPTPARAGRRRRRDRQGRARQGRIRGDADQFLRRRAAAEGRGRACSARARPATSGARCCREQISQQIAKSGALGLEPPAVRDARPCPGAPSAQATPARRQRRR